MTELFNEWPEGSREAAEAAELARVAALEAAAAATTAGEPAGGGLSAPDLAYCRRSHIPGEPVATTGLSADPKEYRARLAEQSDDQIDAWAAELMRDMAIRRGVVRSSGTSARRRGWTSLVSNGCSLPAAGRRPSSGVTARAT